VNYVGFGLAKHTKQNGWGSTLLSTAATWFTGTTTG
jgi:hypothetical protein